MFTEYDYEPDPAPHPENPEDKYLLAATVICLLGAAFFIVWRGLAV